MWQTRSAQQTRACSKDATDGRMDEERSGNSAGLEIRSRLGVRRLRRCAAVGVPRWQQRIFYSLGTSEQCCLLPRKATIERAWPRGFVAQWISGSAHWWPSLLRHWLRQGSDVALQGSGARAVPGRWYSGVENVWWFGWEAVWAGGSTVEPRGNGDSRVAVVRGDRAGKISAVPCQMFPVSCRLQPPYRLALCLLCLLCLCLSLYQSLSQSLALIWMPEKQAMNK